MLEDAEAEAADPHLEAARWQMGTKNAGGHGEAPPEDPPQPIRNASIARGKSWRWVVVEPHRTVSWDNFKIAAMRERPKEKSSAGW